MYFDTNKPGNMIDQGGVPINYPGAIDIVNIPNDEVISLLQTYGLGTYGNDNSQRRQLVGVVNGLIKSNICIVSCEFHYYRFLSYYNWFL